MSQGLPPQEEEIITLNFDGPVRVCQDEDSLSLFDTSEVEVHRYNETSSFMRGYFEILKEIQECVSVEIKVEKTLGSRTDILFTHDICNFCDELSKSEKSKYNKYMYPLSLPECPIGPGKVDIADWTPDKDDLPRQKANAGGYLTVLSFYSNPSCDCEEKVFLGCMLIKFIIETLE
ncbi:unnamed protein product [Chilo suppressalis]|uniref:Uncharacterized protein n=1 Tax=Chilo suppressalis TaxID=168631 RepID=A0ABN8B3Q9_CHISP|nr:hypothetical protein evm_007092 [Chilo suppressalis]CAH0401622.1 unnamed protein product [Chilo suppressalis]